MLMEGPDLGLDLEEDEPFLTHKQRTEQLTPNTSSIHSPSKSPANDNHTPQLLSPTSEQGGQRTFDWGGFDQVNSNVLIPSFHRPICSLLLGPEMVDQMSILDGAGVL